MDLHSLCLSSYELYFGYCKSIKDGTSAGDAYNEQHLAHLALHERTERGEFDCRSASSDGIGRMISLWVKCGRCDLIERYAPQLPDSLHWNSYVSTYYSPSLYAVLPLVMQLPVQLYDAGRYVCNGLHREVMVHIVGRASCCQREGVITLKKIAYWLCYLVKDSHRHLLSLEEVGLDLGNPQLLHDALGCRTSQSTIALLTERCTQAGTLDTPMPDSGLRERLAQS